MFIYAMRLLRELDCPVPAKVLLQVNSDEEVGSDSSRPLTEKEALRSRAVLVLEPALGPAGSVKTARKGVGDYRVRVTGVAAHAGIEHSAGANAIVELARQVERISAFTDLEKGITVNAGVIRGGTRPNVVPEEAVLDVDVRIARLRDAAGIEKKFQSLRPINRRCLIAVSGGLNRPPMERTKGVVALYRTARKLSARMGIELGEGSTGGGSDGNFTGGWASRPSTVWAPLGKARTPLTNTSSRTASPTGLRFWPAWCGSSRIPRLLAASDDGRLLPLSSGCENVGERVTAVWFEQAFGMRSVWQPADC